MLHTPTKRPKYGSLLHSTTTTADEFFNYRRATCPTQNMRLLLQQHLFTDQRAVLAEFMPAEGRARQCIPDLLKTVLRRNNTQIHLVGEEECPQTIEAKQADGNISVCLFDFIGSNDLVLKQPEHINLAKDLLAGGIGEHWKRRKAEIPQTLVLTHFAVIAGGNPDTTAHLVSQLGKQPLHVRTAGAPPLFHLFVAFLVSGRCILLLLRCCSVREDAGLFLKGNALVVIADISRSVRFPNAACLWLPPCIPCGEVFQFPRGDAKCLCQCEKACAEGEVSFDRV